MLVALLPILATAQPGNGGWCASNNYSRLFDAKTIVEMKGTIEKIEKIAPEKGMSVGIHLMVKTSNNEKMSVHLGPAWYLDNQEVQFAASDKITVKGSKITYQNALAIIAVSVMRGEQTLLLRDKKGVPKWNAWRQGAGSGKGKAKGSKRNQQNR